MSRSSRLAAPAANPGPNRHALNLSVIVISYNTVDLTLDCLRSIYREATDVSFEVIVLDNASSDGSAKRIAELFPQVQLIASERNYGFAAGNNIAAVEARGEWLLLLNPDTVVKDHAIDVLLQFACGHPQAAIFGGRTFFGDGTLNPSSCWARPTIWSSFCNGSGLGSLFPESSLFNPESMVNWQRDTIQQVDIVTGCFFMLRKRDWQELGGFDDSYFMYGEEADLCLRAAQRGFTCLICPDARIIHYGGASENVRSDKMVRLFGAKARLFAKHWRPWSARLGIWTLDLWALTRLLAYSAAGLLDKAKVEQRETWRSIWKNRKQWHLEPR